MTTTFSGAHPFRPQCLRAELLRVNDGDEETTDDDLVMFVQMVDDGQCPRCAGPLTRTEREIPSGSRVTPCRCVPVCSSCASAEVLSDYTLAWWTLTSEDLADEGARDQARRRAANPGVLTDGIVITEDGAAPLEMGPPNTGGWAEFGYDDTDDHTEREG